MTVTAINFEAQFLALLFAMLRIGAAFMIAPVFSALGLPLVVRIALAAAVGFLVLGTANVTVPLDPVSLPGLAAAVEEILLGIAFGFVLQIAFAAPLLAGDYIANSMGLGFASMVNPQSGVSSPVLAQFLMIFTTLVFLAADGHLVLVEALVRSYRTLPIGGEWLTAGFAHNVAALGASIFRTGLMIALPVGFALFAINLVIGFMTRSAPQLNIFAVGIPVTLMAGTALLALLFPAMAVMMEAVVDDGLSVVQAMAAGRL